MGGFSKYLAPERVAVMDVKNKREAIDQLLDLLRDSPYISDFAAVSTAVWQREEALATGLGLGIGAPHIRSAAVRDPVAALAVLKKGIEYGSLDEEPVRLILLVAMPEKTKSEWLNYLARASVVFRDTEVREKLMAARNANELWNLLKGY